MRWCCRWRTCGHKKATECWEYRPQLKRVRECCSDGTLLFYRCALIILSSYQSFMLTTVDWSISTYCSATLVLEGHYCIILRDLFLLPRYAYVNIGANGRISDGAVFNNCALSWAVKEGTLNLPNDEALPKSTTEVPYVIVADETFVLHPLLMKPYPG